MNKAAINIQVCILGSGIVWLHLVLKRQGESEEGERMGENWEAILHFDQNHGDTGFRFFHKEKLIFLLNPV